MKLVRDYCWREVEVSDKGCVIKGGGTGAELAKITTLVLVELAEKSFPACSPSPGVEQVDI
jgi:hypothetical protein